MYKLFTENKEQDFRSHKGAFKEYEKSESKIKIICKVLDNGKMGAVNVSGFSSFSPTIVDGQKYYDNRQFIYNKFGYDSEVI